MKKKLYTTILALSLATNIFALTPKRPVQAAKQTETVYKCNKVQIMHVKTEADLDKLNKLASHRKGKILVEIVEGTVLDNKGNGKDTAGYYIGYDKSRFKKGNKVQSVFVYNPENNYCDDIIFRCDTLIK